jgi:uncharacterized RDD family membrane protein YckC
MSKGFWEYKEEEESSKEPVPSSVPQHHAEEISVNCYHHPDRRATAICPKCNIYYCSECMTIRKGKLMCKTCSEVEFAVADDQIKIGVEETLESKIAPERPPDFNPYGTATHSEGTYANPVVKIFAYILDLVIARVLYFILFVVFGFIFMALSAKFSLANYSNLVQSYWPAVIMIKKWTFFVFMLADLFYFFLSLIFKNRTFGMSWLNMRLVTLYGDFAGLTSCFIRALILVLTFSVTEIFAFFSPRKQAMHDWLASVVVINYSGIKDVDPYETISIEM